MRNKLLYCATDNEIYEVLMSSKQKLTDAVLLELAKDRGILYSPKDSRETLVEKIALLPHDYDDLAIILEQREHGGRVEKITSATLNAKLSVADIKEVCREYKEQATGDEKVLTHPEGSDRFVVQVQYSEIDYSKTRLIQRKPKEADIEFIVDDEKTIVRMPANAKAMEVFQDLKNRLENHTKDKLPTVLIELSEFDSAAQRTNFFTVLISSLPGFKLDNVTSVKVEPINTDVDEDALDLDDDQDQEQAKEEALALVRKAALAGESLLASDEYQALQKKGFFITSIIWRAKQTATPYSIVEFEAAFEDPHAGKGFKYSVRGALNFTQGEYTRTLRPITNDDKQRFLTLIEQTAARVISNLREQAQPVKEDLPQKEHA